MVKKCLEKWFTSSTKPLPSRMKHFNFCIKLDWLWLHGIKNGGNLEKVDKMGIGWDFLFNFSSRFINALRVSKGYGACVNLTTCLPLFFCWGSDPCNGGRVVASFLAWAICIYFSNSSFSSLSIFASFNFISASILTLCSCCTWRIRPLFSGVASLARTS